MDLEGSRVQNGSNFYPFEEVEIISGSHKGGGNKRPHRVQAVTGTRAAMEGERDWFDLHIHKTSVRVNIAWSWRSQLRVFTGAASGLSGR